MTFDEAKKEIDGGSKEYKLTEVLLKWCLAYSYLLEYEPYPIGHAGDLASIGYMKEYTFVNEEDAIEFIDLHRYIPSDSAKSTYYKR